MELELERQPRIAPSGIRAIVTVLILLIIPYGFFFLFTSDSIFMLFLSIFYYRISNDTTEFVSLFQSPFDLLVVIIVLAPSLYYLSRVRNDDEVKRPVLLFALVCFATWDFTLILVPDATLFAITNLGEINTLTHIPHLATVALTVFVVLPTLRAYLAKNQEFTHTISEEDDIHIEKSVVDRLGPRSYGTILGIVAFLSPSILTFRNNSYLMISEFNYTLTFLGPLFESQIIMFGFNLDTSIQFGMVLVGSVPIVSILFYYIPQLLFVCQILRYFVGKTTFRKTAIIGLILHLPIILIAIAEMLLSTAAVYTISFPLPITVIAAVILQKRLKKVQRIGPLEEARKVTSVKVPTLYVAISRIKRKIRRESKE